AKREQATRRSLCSQVDVRRRSDASERPSRKLGTGSLPGAPGCAHKLDRRARAIALRGTLRGPVGSGRAWLAPALERRSRAAGAPDRASPERPHAPESRLPTHDRALAQPPQVARPAAASLATRWGMQARSL